MLPDKGPVACRRCQLCRKNRINDWIGRCIAEQRTAKHTLFGTLTYGEDARYASVEDNLDAKMLMRRHITIWLKRVRKWTPGKVRFFITGEYGSKKGRAHWHVLLFCEQMPPNVKFGVRYNHWAVEPSGTKRGRRLWDHGWSYWEVARDTGGAYCAKYILKGDGTEQNEVLLSTQPPLGTEFFRLRAAQHVEQGLSPQDLFYEIPGVVDTTGRPRTYLLRGSAAYNFLDAFVELWRAKHGNDRWPWSPVLDEHMEERRIRELRKAGLPDLTDERFAERSYLENLERKGQWHVIGTAIRERVGSPDARRTYRGETRGAGE